MDSTIEVVDGRSVGFATYGRPGGSAVVWCHGGPGSRMEPAHLAYEAAEAGLLLIGINRPGYGMSTPCPGRTIAGWVPDALAVTDEPSSLLPESPPVVRMRWPSRRSCPIASWVSLPVAR